MNLHQEGDRVVWLHAWHCAVWTAQARGLCRPDGASHQTRWISSQMNKSRRLCTRFTVCLSFTHPVCQVSVLPDSQRRRAAAELPSWSAVDGRWSARNRRARRRTDQRHEWARQNPSSKSYIVGVTSSRFPSLCSSSSRLGSVLVCFHRAGVDYLLGRRRKQHFNALVSYRTPWPPFSLPFPTCAFLSSFCARLCDATRRFV